MNHEKGIQQRVRGFSSINLTGCAEGAFLSSEPGLSLQFYPRCVQNGPSSLLLLLVFTLGILQLLMRFSVSTQKVREVAFVTKA